jgi:predicted ArsR family transcriptional regulator
MHRLDAFGDPGLRAALAFVRGRVDPSSADEVAAGLGLSRSGARWRLERLVESGLLEPEFVNRSGRRGPGAGRPAKTYSVAPETEALEFPPRRFEELLRLLIEALPVRSRRRRLDEVGFAFGSELARAARLRPTTRAPAALERVCRALRALGFQAAVESSGSDRAVLVTATCPLRPLVVGAPAARHIDQGMWRGLVAGALQGLDPSGVRCETHECLARNAPCRILIWFASG